MTVVSLLIFGYLFGSIPFAVVISRLKGINILEAGTHNPGAANVFREVGRKYGIAVWVADTLKGVVPMLAAGLFKQPLIIISCVGAAAVTGHSSARF